jgi:hypothetical protein
MIGATLFRGTIRPQAEPVLREHTPLPVTMYCAGAHARRAICKAFRTDQPYPHWSLRQVLPIDLCRAVVALPFPAPAIKDTQGKRETNNTTRVFVSEQNRARHLACEALAEAFQDEATVALLQELGGRTLAGSSLRIEYCQDTNGFWLEPHTDIGAKLLTMLIYLSDHDDAARWGTDVLDAQHNLVERASGAFNAGLIFLPDIDTWHGFARRPINGVRRSLIINYVKPEWRARHELAFPTEPVRAA